MLLKTIYEHKDRYGQGVDSAAGRAWHYWSKYMAGAAGHNSEGLIAIHFKQPAELGLIASSVQNPMGSFIDATNAGLTPLGLMFCSNIEIYETETHAT